MTLDSSFDDQRLVPDARGAITFAGRGLRGPELKLARDGRRGDLVLHFSSVQGLRAGDCVMIDGPATERWKKLTRNACLWGTYRRYETVIEKVENSTVTLSQPLRLEFPVVNGSYVQNENWLILHNRFVVERGQGVYAGTTSFDHIIQGNVFVLKDGQSPMLFLSRSNCVGVEVRDNRLYGGNGQIAAGQIRPLVMDGNQVLPLGDGPRPTPPVPSIYVWQQNHDKLSH